MATPILSKAQLDAKRAQEIRDASIADSRAKSKRWAAKRRKARRIKAQRHRKVRIKLAKRGRRNARR